MEGRAECIRLFCIYSGLKLEDIRVNRESFKKMKEEGKLMFYQLPVLEVDDRDIIPQSASIMRYLSKFTSAYPSSPLLAAKIDSIVDEEKDLLDGFTVARFPGIFILNLR
jgi:glutathione S-transferase